MYNRKPTYRRPAARPAARPPARYTGGGAYYKRRATGRGAYSVDDAPVANIGARVGSWIGRRIGYYGSRWFGGSGAYYPKSKAMARTRGRGSGSYDISSQRLAPETPIFSSAGDEEGVVICHKEYLGDITSSSVAGGYKAEDFAINPASLETFPWLSQLCSQSYQQYKFESLMFHFKSSSANALNSTNTALGSVFAAINYDYSDQPFTSRYEIENCEWAQSCKPSDDILIPAECKSRLTSLNGLLYILNGAAIPTGTDPRLFFLGRLTIASQGLQGTSVNIGSLYVTYKIRLYKPLMTRPLSNAMVFAAFRTDTDASNMYGATTSVNVNNCDSIGVTISGNVLTVSKRRLRVGQRFMLQWLARGGSTAVTVPTFTASAGWSGIATVPSSTTAPYNRIDVSTASGVTTTVVSWWGIMEVIDDRNDLTMTLSGGTLPSGTVVSQTILLQVCGHQFDRVGTTTF